MSSEGFKNVPGVPEGWELVAIRHAESGEWYMEPTSNLHALAEIRTTYKRPIIRKIEKPKQYRPFANAEEFKPHRDRWVTRIDKSDPEPCPGACPVLAYDESGVWWLDRHQTYEDAFDIGRCFDDDGTPFGVEVTSE